ncbi:MAG: ABC transporter substrate-binding protein [Kiloniellaceae bacterium]
MREKLLIAASAGWLALSAGSVSAETLRYAYRIDPNSLDPYALAETFTLAWLGNMYEPLVSRGKKLDLVPGLAESWENVEPTVWRFNLRKGVKFHEGQDFTADDVVFSVNRVKGEGSDMGYTVASVTEVRAIDDYTVEMVTAGPNPILPQQITSLYMMDKEWSEANGAAEPSSVKAGKENYATTHLNGTGPFKIKERQVGFKTVLVPNADWWGDVAHNLTEVVYTPIESDATRVAALLSGELDMIYPVPVQDVPRVNAAEGVSVLQGPELRTIFLNMDQARDELVESNVKGKNPFKDVRVRKAFYQAIDVETIKERVMGGASRPSALMVGPGINGYDASIDERLPYDPEASKKLLAEAGYPDGFSLGMDCPNDRYVNDEEICLAVVGMLARVGVKVNLLAQTRSKYFEKILSRDQTFSLLGWQPLTYDSHSPLANVMSTPGENIGTYNVGGYSNPRVDELAKVVEVEVDQEKRQKAITEAFKIHMAEVGHIPLHQQAIAWGLRDGVSVVQRPDDSFMLQWVKVTPQS